MNNIFSDIKSVFRRSDKHILQLILVAVAVFLLKNSVSLILLLMKLDNKLLRSEFLNTSWVHLLIKPWSLILFPVNSPNIISLLFESIGIYWIGSILSEFLGSKKALTIVISGALVSGLAFVLFGTIYHSYNPKLDPYISEYGYHACFFTALFAVISLLPDYEIMFFRFRVKLLYLALIMLAIPVFTMKNQAVIFLSASIFGYLYVKFLKSDIPNPFKMPASKKESVFTNVSRNRNFVPGTEQVGVPSQEEIDYLLDKINKKGGYDALSKEEKERLFKASQH